MYGLIAAAFGSKCLGTLGVADGGWVYFAAATYC
jgi:hypothetical protein